MKRTQLARQTERFQPRTIRIMTEDVPEETLQELRALAVQSNKVKNYTASRYGGVKGLDLHNDPMYATIKKEVREDEGVRNIGLNAGYTQIAVSRAMGAVKSGWSRAIDKIKAMVMHHPLLTENERHYIFLILKSKPLLKQALTEYRVTETEALKELGIDEKRSKKLVDLIDRYYRRNRPVQPVFRSLTLDLTTQVYRVKGRTVLISGPVPYHRIKLELKGEVLPEGDLRLVIRPDGRVELHMTRYVRKKERAGAQGETGLDKGMRAVLISSSGKLYGEGLFELIRSFSDERDALLRKRNRIRAQIRKERAAGHFDKARRIEENNFGSKKFNKKMNRWREQIRSLINHSLKEFLRQENPKTVCGKSEFPEL